MVDQTLQEWVAEYAALTKEEIHTFASLQNNNTKISSAIYSIFEEWNKYTKIIDSVCKTLFECYRSGEIELKRFVLQFIPHVIYAYLNSVAHGDKKNSRGLQMLIIGLYNLEVVDENNQPKVISFRLPSLAQSSIYHEPMSLAHASLTESALKRLEECNTKLVKWGPLPQVERLVAQNRLQVLTALLFIYNYNISTLNKHALEQLCKISSRLVSQGFSKHNNIRSHTFQNSSLPRIPLSPQILIELIHGLYFAMYNEYGYMALQSIEDIYQRASYHCYAEVLLLASAVKNTSVAAHPTGLPMGISVDLPTTATNTTTISKSMITNASFRTKKLPDDIPIQIPQEGGSGGGDVSAGNLSAINEEKEDIGASNTPEIAPKRSLPKLAANFGKKTKEKLTAVTKSGGSGGKGNIKLPPNPATASLMNGGGDNSETDESGVDICSELSSLTLVENGSTLDHTTPLNARKSQAGLTVDIDAARSLQVSAI